MLKCPKCGTENPERARFCRSCGARLSEKESAPETMAQMTSEARARRLLEDAFRLSEEGRLLAAIQACQQAISLNPGSTSAHSLLGTLYERQGDRDNAIREYEQVLSLSPGSTVERRRLNELMGIPAAREGMPISPRVARLALGGGIIVVALVIFSISMLGGPRRPQPVTIPAGSRTPGRSFLQQAAEAAPTAIAPIPGRFSFTQPLTLPQTSFIQRPAAAPQPGIGVFQRVGTGSYLMPEIATQPIPVGPRGGFIPPIIGGVPLSGRESPMVRTPSQRFTATMPVRVSASAGLARGYYFQGEYRQAIQTYRSYLAQNPQAGAAPREELAWVYMEAGDKQNAVSEYREALDQYVSDFNRGHNAEAARHGIRTCEAALKALESR